MTGSTSTPASPAALVGAVRGSVAALRETLPGSGAGSWPQETRNAAIAELDAAISDLTVYRGQVLLAHKEDGQWGSVRDRDFTDWRARETGTGRGPAMADLQVAEGLAAMPRVADAVDSGELNLEHAKTLSGLRRAASPEVQKALDAGGLNDLVEHAAREKLTAPQLGKQAKAWAAKIDAAAAQADFDTVRRRRSLTMRGYAGGVKGEFFLDPVAGAELRTALDAISGRPAKDDLRTKDQRMADAMSTMAERVLHVGSDLVGAQVRPHLSLLVGEDTWAGIVKRRREAGGESGAGGGGETNGGGRAPLPDVPPGELEDGTIVPVRELERLMCDCEITRMIMNAEGVPLDVGRTQRTYTKELRRAVLTRDRHCQWPGCKMRASWSEVHHITWFSRGGSTSLEEAICACSYHHHRIHELDVQITVLADGFDFHHPDGRHIGTTRRSATPEIRLPDPAQCSHSAEQTAPQLAAVTGLGSLVEVESDPPATAGVPTESRSSNGVRAVKAAGSPTGPSNAPGSPNGTGPPKGSGPPKGNGQAKGSGPPNGSGPPKGSGTPKGSAPPNAAGRPKGSGPPRAAPPVAPRPRYPSSYATAPASLWDSDSDPPF